jgi:peptidoglycan/LPS O-acetylase OafA/YrhL
LLIGVLFFHVYTWTILAAIAGVFLLTMLVIQNKQKNNTNNNNYFPDRRIIWLLLFAILPSIVVDVSKVLLTGSSGGLEQDIELAQRGLGIEQFNLRWEILNTTIYHSLGGVFSNFIILLLGLFWVLKSNMREPYTVFLIIFLSAGIVPLFFGTWHIQARVFYDIPFEIPAAMSLYYISKRSGSMLVILAGCTWLVAISLFTVMNYILVAAPAIR